MSKNLEQVNWKHLYLFMKMTKEEWRQEQSLRDKEADFKTDKIGM